MAAAETASETIPLMVAWGPTMRAHEDAAWSVTLVAARVGVWDSVARAVWAAPRDADRNVDAEVAEVARTASSYAATVVARETVWACSALNGLAAFDHPTQRTLANIYLPMIDAFEAGLFLYWVTPKEIVCVPAPTLSLRDGRLHNDAGPAVQWRSPDHSPG
ncbi:MAG: hypothetical protein ACREC6_12635, partial [Hyphomicrobiaceae bacterium]